MNRLTSLLCVVAVCTLSLELSLFAAPQKQPVIVVGGRIVIAFFPPTTNAELQKDADTNEALADFQFYAKRVRDPLTKAGIDFQEVYARSFQVRVGQDSAVFRPSKANVGYYLVSPGKKPRVEYGVMSDTDLLQVANEYFGIAAK